MDETQVTPVAEATPATEAQAKQDPAPVGRAANAVAELRKMLESKRAPAAEPSPAPASTPAVEKTIEKIEAAGGKAPDQRVGESDAQYAIRAAKAFRELRQSNERATKAEKAAETTSAENAKLRKMFDAGKANPLSALKELGWTFADVVKAINEDKIKEPEKSLELPPEIAEKLERLDRAEREREEQRLAASRQSERATHENQVSSFIKDNASDFPLASVMPGIAGALIDEAYEKGITDIVPLLAKMEETLSGELIPVFGNETALKALVAKKPELRAILIKALGLEAAPAPAPAAASSIDQISTEPGTPGSKKTRDQVKAEALAGLKRMRAGG